MSDRATLRLTGVVTERPAEVNSIYPELRELIAENDRLIQRNKALQRQRNVALDRVAELEVAEQQLLDELQRQSEPVRRDPIELTRLSLSKLAALRRAKGTAAGENVALCQGVMFDSDGWRLVSDNGAVVRLSAVEGMLLRALVQRSGKTVQHAELIAAIWGSPSQSKHILNVNVSRLRTKLRQAGADGLITTIPGIGLRLAVQP